MAAVDNYEFFQTKIKAMKDKYVSLRDKSAPYVFSALCFKSHFYKNPAYVLNDNDFNLIIVDGQYDGGVDCLFTDPSSEESNMVIAQAKYYQSISSEEAQNAITKMCLFYKEMLSGHFETVNGHVQSRFLTLHSEVGEESKVIFVLYTSAPQKHIKKDKLQRKFRDEMGMSPQFELKILFGDDIATEIKEAESRRPTVETGKIKIDKKDNCLWYGDNAIIVNVSAYSIKSLYAHHNTNLLARNLRYHVSGSAVDKAINNTIANEPDSFWYKNNGITIVCDDFAPDGREIKLENFSIVNGGQTSYMIHKSKHISETEDLYLPCKIIRTLGESEDEKNLFSLEVAKATNSQKAIKPSDLKANSPEQVRFSHAMREAGIFYQTKRGEKPPTEYKPHYLNSDLGEIGKLCLSAIFQMPGTSRNKPSTLYNDQYYDFIFNGNQQ